MNQNERINLTAPVLINYTQTPLSDFPQTVVPSFCVLLLLSHAEFVHTKKHTSHTHQSELPEVRGQPRLPGEQSQGQHLSAGRAAPR